MSEVEFIRQALIDLHDSGVLYKEEEHMSGDHTKYHGTAEVPKREWAGLTKKEINAIADGIKEDGLFIETSTWHIRFAKAVQRKLKEKNT